VKVNSPNLAADPHRRFNPLTGEWVLVSPQRAQRPWQGQVERHVGDVQSPYDPECYLCPGNARAGGVKNPHYGRTFVFDNDFAALKPETPDWESDEGGLLRARSESGICRVVCYSPRHDLTMARMAVRDIVTVVDTWTEQFAELAGRANIRSIQIFENRGAMMGCSNPHPHGQIWADRTTPNEPAKEEAAFRVYRGAHGSTLLADYLAIELRQQERVVCSNEHFAVVVPYWAVWPFETLVISRRAVPSMLELLVEERLALADILSRITIRYDNLFQTSFPYTMGFHQAPSDGEVHHEFHLHAHFYPPLLRSATVKKFMVGYEMLGMPQRDITPEAAAAFLREQSEKHYLNRE
jgi:UDPglucose--hexose-1-phosphate uridylyltransferase